MTCFRDHSNKIKVDTNSLFHMMKAIFTNIRTKKWIAQNLVKVRKCRLPKNEMTFFHLLFKWHPSE